MSDFGINFLKTLDQPIAFQRAFVTLAGSIDGALMLSHAVSSARADNAGGWFWITRDQWEDATGLTQGAQRRALNKLQEKGIGAGVFGSKGLTTGHISLNWSELGVPGGALDVIKKRLGRPIPFHRAFVTFTGSINAALMLSHAVHLKKCTPDGCFWRSYRHWQRETGLSRTEQCQAQQVLREKGLLLVDKERNPPWVCYRVDTGKLQEYLQQTATPAKGLMRA